MLRHIKSLFCRRKLCLIADNSVAIRSAARTILRDLAFHTTEAENGLEALQTCQQHLPDAILLDGSMPQMNGFEFLRALRERHSIAGAEPKIIFCTVDRDPAVIARAIDAGAHEYVIKPFDRSILLGKLERLGLVA
ncbi:MAG: response regulator [Alphaproteobacteria bacterium]